ncbi:hypothetical protein BCR39DRAFT_552705 [Naematelia encephala]|uniref:Uncharacterized protein n=1 Tax=Naematelia encephala TaxID=71784 RepID=A0A1Y2AH52_9TREE|nr:hypothetical protein BCR39DRAFT_552705 [Naematelia encephala]
MTNPPGNPHSALEAQYNTAVQSFVRRDHIKTHSTLSRLLSQLAPLTNTHSSWYDLEPPSSEDEWRVKVLKLVISAHASLYADPPVNTTALSPDLVGLLPPCPPDRILEHVQKICEARYFSPSLSSSSSSSSSVLVLPPALISTLLLAALKLRPAPSALSFAHNLAENYLSNLPDSFLLAISTSAKFTGRGIDGVRESVRGVDGLGETVRGVNGFAESGTRVNGIRETGRGLEGYRQGHIKVLQLFVGEVLVREGEYEMARGILDGDEVLGSKRKESLYRHIRSYESRTSTNLTSSIESIDLSHSLSLSSPTLNPTRTPTFTSKRSSKISSNSKSNSSRSKSRSSSTSSSSSERTARPNSTTGLIVNPLRRVENNLPASINGNGNRNGKDKHKDNEREKENEKDETTSQSSIPSKIYIHHPQDSHSSSTSKPTTRSETFNRLWNRRRRTWISNIIPFLPESSILQWKFLPIPLLAGLIILMTLRRRFILGRNKNRMNLGAGVGVDVGVVVGGGGVGVLAMNQVRQRLLRARLQGQGQGWRQWVMFWLEWWIKRFIGVWNLATTVTYV